MSKNSTQQVTINVNKTLVTVGITLLVIFGWLWWKKVYTSPRVVFREMLDTNLSVYSTTKQTKTAQSSESQDQASQINLGAQNAVHIKVSLTQKDENSESTVASESIGTPTADYNRYISIKTNQKNAEGKEMDFSKVIGIWGKSDASAKDQSTPAQYFKQSLAGIVPVANLSPQNRQKILKMLEDKKVYTPKYDSIKQEVIDGKPVFTYSVEVKLQPYVEVLQEITKLSGLGTLEGLDPDQYKEAPPVKVSMSIGKISRQLMRLKLEDAGREESFNSFGLRKFIDIPQNTIPQAELQQRIQELQ